MANQAESGPCSFVVKRGNVGKELGELVSDLRSLMLPNSFSKVKESKRNGADDYIHVASSLGATHLIRISSTSAPHLHISRLSAGPCFDFRIDQFSLVSDLRQSIGEMLAGGVGVSHEDAQFPPVAILNGFKSGTSEFTSLLAEALKGMIPSIDITKINPRTCKRVVLFDYNESEGKLSIRHFRVGFVKKSVVSVPTPSSSSSSVSTSCDVMLNSRKSIKIPNLGNLVSISDLIVSSKKLALETAEATSTDQPATSSALSAANSNTLVLTEIGPRIDATLARVLTDVEAGTVLFSRFDESAVGSVIKRKKQPKVVRPDKRPKRENNGGFNDLVDDASMSD